MHSQAPTPAGGRYRSRTDSSYLVEVLLDNGPQVDYREVADHDNLFSVDKEDFLRQFEPVTS